jgi:uncharacterized phiE125 gp8 family phage protein
MSLTLVTEPEVEPLTRDDLKAHLRIALDQTDDDAYLDTLIVVVRQRCENATRRTLITQTWDLFLDQWPTWDGYHGGQTFEPVNTLLPSGGFLLLPKPPLQRVTFVKYTDLSGAVQTWDPTNYIVDAPSGPRCARGRLALGWVKVWPVIQPVMNAIQIRMVTGYGDADTDVPAMLKQAMLLDAGTLYANREAIMAGARAASTEIVSTTRDIYKAYRSL